MIQRFQEAIPVPIGEDEPLDRTSDPITLDEVEKIAI